MHIALTEAEQARFAEILRGYADDPRAQRMKRYIQHGHISTFRHCMRVARLSFWLNCRLHFCKDEVSLVRGAFLHDFYLYDWHNCSNKTHWHGFTHPATALENAEHAFTLNDTERDVIGSHMWPLTLRHIPRSREAAMVCAADKVSSAWETVMERREKKNEAIQAKLAARKPDTGNR